MFISGLHGQLLWSCKSSNIDNTHLERGEKNPFSPSSYFQHLFWICKSHFPFKRKNPHSGMLITTKIQDVKLEFSHNGFERSREESIYKKVISDCMPICTLHLAKWFKCHQLLLLLHICQKKFCFLFYICTEEVPIIIPVLFAQLC